jgi:hypothetical protein
MNLKRILNVLVLNVLKLCSNLTEYKVFDISKVRSGSNTTTLRMNSKPYTWDTIPAPSTNALKCPTPSVNPVFREDTP